MSLDLSGASFADAPRAPEAAGVADRSVRPALAGDAAVIARIQSRALLGLLGAEAPAEEILAGHWARTLSAPAPEGHRVLVALHANAVVGFALVTPGGELSLGGGEAVPPGAEIAELLIDPDFTRSGHASRLLAAIAEVSQAPNLRAWARPEDEARTRLLQACGFAPAGVLRTLVKPDGSLFVEHLWWAATGE